MTWPALAGSTASVRAPEKGSSAVKARWGLIKIVSGGQTGADRAALDWAIARGLGHGGWCPKGRKAEDGTIPRQYRLTEAPSDSYVQRTECNVRDSDGTVILSLSETLTGGSRKTAELARQYGRPWLHLSRAGNAEDSGERLRRFVQEHGIRVLNVAGPRASTEPNIGGFVTRTLDQAFGVAPRPSRRGDDAGRYRTRWRR